ncbi:MAG TPA: hypothetical protein VF595_12290 [Tepidisphaeraceae bacterium]|jgi:hypothetical protein
MSRISSGDVIRVAPTNNVYTGLAAAAFVATLVATVLFFLKASDVLGKQLFQ